MRAPGVISSPLERKRTIRTTAGLPPLVKAMGYRGGAFKILEAMPHFRDGMDIADLRATLVNLGYGSECQTIRPRDIDPRLMPCAYEWPNGEVAILLSATEAGIEACVAGKTRILAPHETRESGFAYFFKPLKSETAVEAGSWAFRLARRFRGYLLQLIAISAVSNLLGIAVPLFVMIVYDRVIGHRALDALPMLVLGTILVIAMDLYFRSLRAHLLGAMASRIDYLIATATFAKLIRLPLSYTSGPPIGAQISRLKEFQSVRDLFSGPAAAAIVDFPFTIFALAAIALVAGWLVLAPLVACLLFALAGYLGTKWLQAHERAQSEAATEVFSHVTDMTLNHEAVRREGAESNWLYRFRLKSAAAATHSSELQSRTALLEGLSLFLNNAAALSILASGTILVIDGVITIGALIATMALTWRILSPAQHLFQTLARLNRLGHSIRAMDQLLRLPDEYSAAIPTLARAPAAGRIAFNRVSLRYRGDAELAIMNFNLTIPPRKTIAIAGSNGSGKSSIFRVLMGLYPPQSGMVTIDGVDIRQLSPAMLRRAISCVPQEIDLFYGTIAQNLQIADPLADDDTMKAAADMAGVLDSILRLPQGFDTRIGDVATTRFPPGFLRQLTIARALMRDAPILLLDEPEAMLDDQGAVAVGRMIERLRGQRTILFISHRPSLIKLADFALLMRSGVVEYGGTPAGVIEKLLGQNGAVAA